MINADDAAEPFIGERICSFLRIVTVIEPSDSHTNDRSNCIYIDDKTSCSSPCSPSYSKLARSKREWAWSGVRHRDAMERTVTGAIGSVEKIGDSSFQFRPYDSTMSSSVHKADKVFSIGTDMSPASLSLYSSALPVALGAVRGVHGSLVACRPSAAEGSIQYPTQQESHPSPVLAISDAYTLLWGTDTPSKKCVGLLLLESLAEECRRVSRPLYISIGTVSINGPRIDEENYCHIGLNSECIVHDIIGSDANAMSPMRAILKPNIRSSDLFGGAMTDIDVSGQGQCADVFYRAMYIIRAFKARYAISADAHVFITANVPVGPVGNTDIVGSFTLLDMCNAHHVEGSLCISDKYLTDPFLGGNILSLLAFGVCMCNKVLMVASCRDHCNDADMCILRIIERIMDTYTMPINVSENERNNKDLPHYMVKMLREKLEISMKNDDVGLSRINLKSYMDDDESRLYVKQRDILRQQMTLRHLTLQHRTTKAMLEQLQQDWREAQKHQLCRREEATNTAASPSIDIPSAEEYNNNVRVLSARCHAVREMEVLQCSERERLWRWQSQLASYPIIQEEGLHYISETSRAMLLENIITAHEEENERLRAMYSRDIKLLKMELEMARSGV